MLLATSVASGRATTVATAPAGFVRTTVGAASSANRYSTSLIATPLLNAPVYAGRVASARAASGATEIASQSVNVARPDCFDISQPHAVFVTSGVFAGFTFRVLGASAQGITVDGLGFDLAQILAPGDTFDVRPLHTFRSLFGDVAARVPFTAAPDAAHADQLLIQRDGTWRAYWFTGSVWRRAGSTVDAGDDVILPQDGIVVYHRTASAVDVRFLGDAPSTDAVISVPAGAVSTVANPFPVDATIGEFGFETVSGWQCAAQPDQADQVQVCEGNAWRTYWHNGTTWTHTAGTTDGANIPAGTAMIVVRKASPAANPFALVTRPYDL
ncbi:MAG: TIGR02597 family protein [Opitutaceae bacterium]|nr:TIGR02597 family protein [Opitutaceae bacterium]